MATEHIPYGSGEEFCEFVETCMVSNEGIPRFKTSVNGFDLPNRFIANCMYGVASIPGVMFTSVPEDVMFNVKTKNLKKIMDQCNVSMSEPTVQSATRLRREE